MTKLSIITICYNEQNLKKTCESIVNQTWQDFEWIVIDGGSGQETQETWNKYKHRIDKFVSEPDNGIYNAYNKGISFANGDYLIFMNAGDKFFCEQTLSMSQIMLDGSDILYGQTELVLNNNASKIITFPKNLYTEFFIFNNINTQSIYIKKDIFYKYGFFDEQYKIVADYDKWIQLIKSHVNFTFLPIVVASYNLCGISASDDATVESNKILNKYFSKKTIDNAWKNEMKPSLLENIFSIKNSKINMYKIIKLFGLYLKVKR